MKRWTPSEIAGKIVEFEKVIERSGGQREAVAELEIPRFTLQHWLSRKDKIDANPEIVAFLHRIVLGAHFVMTLPEPCGIRLVCLFFELTGLDQFVAASYGAQQKVSVAMEECIVAVWPREKKSSVRGYET